MAEGDRTPGEESPGSSSERDLLAARRARRAELGDAALIRRAEAAEVTVRTLESHLADLRRRVREAEEEQRRVAEQLAAREHELRRVKQREYAEQQLRVEAEEQRERLEREQRGELDRLQRRLGAGERHARELADRLEVVRRELSEAEQEAATGRAAARGAEQELAKRERELAERERELARRELLLEQQIQDLNHSRARMESIVQELKGIAVQLRGVVQSEASPAERARKEPDREEMAQALAAAVARLRARVASPPESEPEVEPEAAARSEPAAAAPQVEPEVAAGSEPTMGAEPVPAALDEPEPEPAHAQFIPRVLPLGGQRESWLAPAIRRVAAERDAKLAGELICELLPAQRLKRALTYTLRIEGLGDVQVRVEGERATVRRPSTGSVESFSGTERGAFLLEGPVTAFAELAAGGAGRRLPGVKVRGSRRKLRRLLATRRKPLALSDLAEGGITIWPGLLLLALSEAIDPQWTQGHSFILAFAITGPPSATLYVQVRDGEPLAVTRMRSEQPLSTVHLDEQAFLLVLCGAPLPPTVQVLLEGSAEPLSLLLGWSDRAQGLAR
ncbi:MAG TPA: hypothetical protein VGY76_06280 [Solirubrobacteraceae bacterium]|jgi:hypothetical protein|nr:hypothetical protein [Solirubrobacteraceae bacterium]